MRNLINECWKLFENENYNSEKEKIYISNYGRVIKKNEDGKSTAVKIGKTNSFETFPYPRLGKERRYNYYLHRAVAELFLQKQPDQNFVIHKNHDLTDNVAENLQWVSQKELTQHQMTNPKRIEKIGIKPSAKLSEGRVRMIKKKVLDPNRKTRMRLIAKQFGISTMQLYRIKSGENWGEVKV